jgi:cobalt-precorrin-5B (C1)-methyltransferase
VLERLQATLNCRLPSLVWLLIVALMKHDTTNELRRGWTTGACATAAAKAALTQLWSGDFAGDVTITLPKGETPVFALALAEAGDGWARVGITKDAGDDPDVTHGALIVVTVRTSTGGVQFRAGAGVGMVTKAGLPIGVGEPAINPVPRQMITAEVVALAAQFGKAPDVEIEIAIPGGEDIALKTWNPRLGIEGGLSILGTTGVVRPFSCAAWIASIHRGIDVARANGMTHVAGCTGAMSEATVQRLYNLPDYAMLDMGDFAGGMLKYLAKHPVQRVTVGGGIGKITKLAQGAIDLHSGRSQVNFAALAEIVGIPEIAEANSALEAYQIAGASLADLIAKAALAQLNARFGDAGISYDVVIIDRAGKIIAQAVA